jgi:hypothetical protein
MEHDAPAGRLSFNARQPEKPKTSGADARTASPLRALQTKGPRRSLLAAVGRATRERQLGVHRLPFSPR